MQEVAVVDQQQPQGENQQVEEQRPAKSYTQADLDRITAKVRRNAANETEARLRRELSQGGGERKAEPEKPAELKEPKRDQEPWASMAYEDYLDARADFAGKKAARDERERVSKEETARQTAERQKEEARAFKKHADALIDELPDFVEKIENASDVMISEAMGDAIRAAGALGPRILYYLVDHPQESERIAELKSTAAQAREIGKIEAKIEAEVAAKKKPAPKEGEEDQEQERKAQQELESQRADSERDDGGRFKAQEKGPRKAPDPIEPGSGRSANMDRGPTDKDTDSDWFAKRIAQEKSERDRQRRK